MKQETGQEERGGVEREREGGVERRRRGKRRGERGGREDEGNGDLTEFQP